MANVTLSIDAKLLKEARRAALEKGTTVNQLIRNYLIWFVQNETGQTSKHRTKLFQVMKKGLAPVSEITWTRDELHEC